MWYFRLILEILFVILFVIDKIKRADDPYYALKADADEGDLTAQYNLALKYYEDKEYHEAFNWMSRAAKEHGDPDAQYFLGCMYDDGIGTPQDYQEALKWYSMAARQGHSEAQCNLGMMYENGLGVEQDYSRAFYLYSEATKKGLVQAQYNLATMYENGLGVQQNESQAVILYRRAARQGDEDAQEKLRERGRSW